MSAEPPPDLPDGVTVATVNEMIATSFPGNSSRATALGPGWAEIELPPGPGSIRPGDIISGPTVFGAADVALWFALFTKVGIEPMALTSELSIRFLRPARGDTVRARADIHHAGRRSVIGSVTCWTDDPDRPVAVAQGTYVRPTTS